MVIDRHISICDCRKALQNSQHDCLLNAEVLYIYIFYFFKLNRKKNFDV